MTSITVEGLRKEFGDIIAVDGLDFEIRDGEYVTIVGPSGCGKTTTLRLLAGLELATAGSIRFDDEEVTERIPSRRNVGMVFQNLALYPHMSVRENMAFGLRVGDVPKAEHEERIVETAEMLDIAELLDRSPEELSGGQQQRVAIGRTLVRQPDVFLLDEPLASLDAKLRAEIRAELQRLHQRIGVTTIYVTHDQHQAMTMSDRVIVMNEGRIQQFDTPERVYDEPQNTFVADFVGTPSINFFDCEVTDAADGYFIDLGFHRLRLDRDRLERPDDSQPVVGVRPEHVSIDPNGSEGFTADIRFIEPTGKEQIIRLTVDGEEFTALVSDDLDLDPTEQCSVSFDTDRLYIFDRETSARLEA